MKQLVEAYRLEAGREVGEGVAGLMSSRAMIIRAVFLSPHLLQNQTGKQWQASLVPFARQSQVITAWSLPITLSHMVSSVLPASGVLEAISRPRSVARECRLTEKAIRAAQP